MSTISETRFEVVSTGQEFAIPGEHSVQSIVSTYAANVPGLANMEAQESVTDGVKKITFRPRTGTKG